MDIISEILNDSFLNYEIAKELAEKRAQKRDMFLNSQYTFSLVYYPNQKNKLGAVDTFQIEGGKNAVYVLGLKMEYNVGISELRISRNGKRIQVIRFKGNEEKSKKYNPIRIGWGN
jgi:hypothetical protein